MTSPVVGNVERTSIAKYKTYAEAQRAVDYLSDQKFPVQTVQIIGTELRMVEQVFGRLNWGRAILSGFAGGAWVGIFVGLLFLILVPAVTFFQAIGWGLLYGGIFGAVFGALGYAFTGGRRDFVSRSAIIPSTFDIMVESAYAAQASQTLESLGR